MEAPPGSQMLTSNHTYKLTRTHFPPRSGPPFRFLGLNDPSLFWMNLSSPFSITSFPPEHELAANKSSTPLPTTLISPLPPHGHIYWASLCFLPSHSLPSPLLLALPWKRISWRLPLAFLLRSPVLIWPLGNIWLLVTPTVAFLTFTSGLPPSSPRPPSQTSLQAPPVNAGVPSSVPGPLLHLHRPPGWALHTSALMLTDDLHIPVSSPHLPLELNLNTQLLLEGSLGVAQATHIHHRTCYLSPQTCCISAVQRILLFKQSYEICLWFISLSPSLPHINQSVKHKVLSILSPNYLLHLISSLHHHPATSLSHIGVWNLLPVSCIHLASPVHPSPWSWRSSSKIQINVPQCSPLNAPALS